MKKIIPVSIVIPIRDWESVCIDRIASSISHQTVWPKEVVVVNTSKNCGQSSLNRLDPLFPSDLKVKLLFAPNAYPGKARNIGAETAEEPLIAFLDVLTVPDVNWLNDSYKLIQENSYDGVIGKCRFVGKSFFSWILIDGLFGRGAAPTLPGSLFRRDGLRKVGPMLDRSRAGEDNEWLQRAQLMDVNFTHAPDTATCVYHGYENIKFSEFCNKWNRNYQSAARLPQYKLISQFNLLVWFSFALGIAFNWNAFFAEWDTSHPMYLPHISKLTLSLLLTGYIFFRVIYLPIKRGSDWRQILSYRAVFILVTVITADAIKSFAFLLMALRRR